MATPWAQIMLRTERAGSPHGRHHLEFVRVPEAWVSEFEKSTEYSYTDDTSTGWERDMKDSPLLRRLFATHLGDPALTLADGEAIRSVVPEFPMTEQRDGRALVTMLKAQEWGEAPTTRIINLKLR